MLIAMSVFVTIAATLFDEGPLVLRELVPTYVITSYSTIPLAMFVTITVAVLPNGKFSEACSALEMAASKCADSSTIWSAFNSLTFEGSRSDTPNVPAVVTSTLCKVTLTFKESLSSDPSGFSVRLSVASPLDAAAEATEEEIAVMVVGKERRVWMDSCSSMASTSSRVDAVA